MIALSSEKQYLYRQLRLTSDEVRLVEIMLLANPVAAKGEPTMLPVSTLLRETGVDRSFLPQLRRVLFDLTENMRSIDYRGGSILSFPVLGSFYVSDEGRFLLFQFNEMFLDVLTKFC